jgi:hypothetical protein
MSESKTIFVDHKRGERLWAPTVETNANGTLVAYEDYVELERELTDAKAELAAGKRDYDLLLSHNQENAIALQNARAELAAEHALEERLAGLLRTCRAALHHGKDDNAAALTAMIDAALKGETMDRTELVRELRVDAEWLRAKCGPVGEQVAARIVRAAALLSESGTVSVPVPFSIRLASPGHVLLGRTTVDIKVNGEWVVLIAEAGDIFCHIIEPAGIARLISAAKEKP